MRWNWLFPALICVSACAQDELPTFRTEVKLVNVFTGVISEQNGRPVAHLAKENFALYEDGAPQTISVFERESVLPLSIVLAVDTSLSTRKDLRLELESAKNFARVAIRPRVDALSLYEVSTTVSETLGFTSDTKRIDRAIGAIRAGGATALYDAIFLAGEALKRQNGRRVVVLITDGGDTASSTSYGAAVRSALEAEAIVYSIIVTPIEADAGRNIGGEHALIQVSQDTGGRYFYAKNIEQVSKAFDEIADELRTQYRLAYYPAKKLSDSDMRRIEVRLVDVPGRVTAHFRTVYFTH
ncbi:MAG: hypothetical protein NVS9B15_20860 [Acidobacteriaceae bacterium]